MSLELHRRCLCGALAIVVALSTTVSSPLFAQQKRVDFIPPKIVHDAQSQDESGDVRAFVAMVTDNEEVRTVTFHYRPVPGDRPFLSEQMEVLGENRYRFVLDAGDSSDRVEYYLRAEDATGNAVFKGSDAEPLLRELSVAEKPVDDGEVARPTVVPAPERLDLGVPPMADESLEEEPDISIPAAANEIAETPRSRPTLLYIALGVLVVGGIAAAAGGGDSDPTCCSLTLQVQEP